MSEPVLLPARRYMTAEVHRVSDTLPLDEVWRRMAAKRVSCLPVVDHLDRPIGVVSRFDLLRVGRLRARTAAGETLLDLPDQPVRRIMHPRIITIENDSTVRDAAATMLDCRVHRVFVRQAGALVGVVSTKDVMRAIADAALDPPIGPLASRPVVTIGSAEPIAAATDQLARSHVQGIVVLEDGKPVGLFGQLEALEAQALAPGTAVGTVASPALLCLSADTALWRAARLAADSCARRILTIEDGAIAGIVTGLDFARALL